MENFGASSSAKTGWPDDIATQMAAAAAVRALVNIGVNFLCSVDWARTINWRGDFFVKAGFWAELL